jgi:hypothetical protein
LPERVVEGNGKDWDERREDPVVYVLTEVSGTNQEGEPELVGWEAVHGV